MKNFLIRFAIAVVLICLTAVTALLPSPLREYAAYADLGLFSAVLMALIAGWFYGAVTGALCPVVLWLLETEASAFFPEVVILILVNVVTAVFADIMFRTFKTAIFACISGLLLSRILIIIFRVAECLLQARSYTVGMYLEEAYLDVWPGILMILVLIPLVVRILKRAHVLRFSRRKAGN